jgi:hypothetical protein
MCWIETQDSHLFKFRYSSGTILALGGIKVQRQQSIEAKAQCQQYLTPFEGKAMIDFILQMSAFGMPVQVEYIPSTAFKRSRH